MDGRDGVIVATIVEAAVFRLRLDPRLESENEETRFFDC
jgi:hypothetical protein